MKQAVIISGKGGTGKTSLTGSFAALSRGAIFADCDVDASNLHILLKPRVLETIEFKGLPLAQIDEAKCTHCGACLDKCRFGAIKKTDAYAVDPLHCEGCGVCIRVCPVGAASFTERICGYAYVSDTRFGSLVHARLNPGMESSGKLVTLVRQTAQRLAEQQGKGLVLVDGPPGIGCPTIASLSGVDAAVVVVEPSLSGIHDLKRALELLDHFKVAPMVCVNKHDINPSNTEAVEAFCDESDLPIIGLVPFDDSVTNAMVNGLTVVEHAPNSPAGKAINAAWQTFKENLG